MYLKNNQKSTPSAGENVSYLIPPNIPFPSKKEKKKSLKNSVYLDRENDPLKRLERLIKNFTLFKVFDFVEELKKLREEAGLKCIGDNKSNILPSKITGLKKKNQKKLAKIIKHLRHLSILPFCGIKKWN